MYFKTLYFLECTHTALQLIFYRIGGSQPEPKTRSQNAWHTCGKF